METSLDYDESPEDLADQILALSDRTQMRGSLIQVFSHLQSVKARLKQWEADAEDEFVIDKGNDDSVVEVEDDTKIRYESFASAMSSRKEEVKDEDSAGGSRCFNCGARGCNVRDCKEPKDHARIAANRRQFGGGGQGPQARYHVDEHQKYGHIKPGLPSKRLRKALGIKDDRRLPEFIYRMRDLGYPPAWKRFAQVNHSGLSLYMDRGRVLTAEETTNGEDGELEQDFDEKQVQYDAEKLQEWPGFNTDPPKGTLDESRYYRAPQMQKHHSISYMKENLPLYEQKGYVRGEMPDTNVSLEEAEGNDGEEIEKPEVSPFAGAASGSGASGTVKSCDDGTPIVTTYSPFSTIPDSSKWTTNTTDHIFFENLPDSTGKYEQFKELLKKCRKTRQNLEKAATQSETAASQEESNKDANPTESQTPASASDVIDIT